METKNFTLKNIKHYLAKSVWLDWTNCTIHDSTTGEFKPAQITDFNENPVNVYVRNPKDNLNYIVKIKVTDNEFILWNGKNNVDLSAGWQEELATAPKMTKKSTKKDLNLDILKGFLKDCFDVEWTGKIYYRAENRLSRAIAQDFKNAVVELQLIKKGKAFYKPFYIKPDRFLMLVGKDAYDMSPEWNTYQAQQTNVPKQANI